MSFNSLYNRREMVLVILTQDMWWARTQSSFNLLGFRSAARALRVGWVNSSTILSIGVIFTSHSLRPLWMPQARGPQLCLPTSRYKTRSPHAQKRGAWLPPNLQDHPSATLLMKDSINWVTQMSLIPTQEMRFQSRRIKKARNKWSLYSTWEISCKNG